MYFQAAGAGRSVIFLHGMGASSESWPPGVLSLSQRFRVITLTLRGFGKDPGPQDYTMTSWVQDIKELAMSLQIEKTCLVGFSMGGLVAARFAVEFPKVLQGLVLVGSLGELPEPMIQLFRNRAELARNKGIEPIVEDTLRGFSEEFKKTHPKGVSWYADLLRQNKPESYAYACDVLVKTAGPLSWDKIICPILMIRGAMDSLIPSGAVDDFRQKVKNCLVREIEDCGHFVPLESPDTLGRILSDFLTGIFP